jgi:outer membrane protein OmpA-like peptidoglycan-associated protein
MSHAKAVSLVRSGLVVAVAALFAACSAGAGAPALSSVPRTMPSLDNDRAQMQTDIEDSRVATLRDRMAALKDEKAEAEAAKSRDITINDAPTGPTNVSMPVHQDMKLAAQVDNPTPQIREMLSDSATQAAAAMTGLREMAAPTPPAAPAAAPQQPAYPAPASTPEEVKRKLADVFVSRDSYTHYLGAISFANGQRELTQKQLTELANMVERLLKKDAKGMFIVQGFSSVDKNRTPQTDLANLRLSLRRAEVVRDALIFMGVDRENIHLEAHGIDNPHNLPQPNRRAVVWFHQ